MTAPRGLALALALLAAACAQGPTLQERLSVWIGRSELDLLSELGVPTRTYELDGRRFLLFEQRSVIPVAAPAYAPMWGPWGYRGGWPAPASYATVTCDVTFILRNQVVENFTFRGQGC
ncbi:hypothetical protein [Roseomonas sp. AR75]|jgi:hypothetical protein|uniref:hypothetical protein n=1 Tax=Roseomonas sp. AR75 TaxID=2562311 RepID=UPI0010C0807D|nr:hypothetical protein [Roseomonas sp. AR75]